MGTAEIIPLAPASSSTIRRRGSFTDVEKFCLRALLLDVPNHRDSNNNNPRTTHHHHLGGEHEETTAAVGSANQQQRQAPHDDGDNNNNKHPPLDETVLFQLPFSNSLEHRSSRQFGRHEKKLLGLWQAHADNLHPVVMAKRKHSANYLMNMDNKRPSTNRLSSGVGRHSRNGSSFGCENPQFAGGGGDGSNSIFGMDDSERCSRASSTSAMTAARSDVEICPPREPDELSSWGEEDGGFVHYNAWEVLNDEYAEDFGFDFKETLQSISATLANEDEDCQGHVFKILGTSADDVTAQPHVLSPPLMDSLLNFLPDSISMENFWLKFSLVRDGASLYTLKQYVKATPYTILAIETTKGDVFGAFTSSTWRNAPTFFGGAPAFLWRMRHNRRTPCHSLFDQAQMESEIDVYGFSGLNDLVQVCDESKIAIGGGKLVDDDTNQLATATGTDVESLEAGQNFGFGIALDEHLLSGTTSPCGTFRNPCLINNLSKGETFHVANLEMWTFTPCADVKSAERMEMTRFFVEESVRSTTSAYGSTYGSTYGSAYGSTSDVYSNPFASQDEFQRDFYRRIGHNPTSGHHRKGSFEYRHLVAPSSRR